MSQQGDSRARRAVEIAVFAPFGLLAYLRDAAPTLVTVLIARGRGEVDRTRSDIGRRVQHVRNYGDAAIAFGLKQRREGENTDRDGPHSKEPGSADGRSEPNSLQAVPDVAEDTAATPRGTAHATQVADDSVGLRRQDLAIPGYDSLSASQVVERLPGLDKDQLDAVRSYEEETRRRRTILGKIDQLTA